MKYLKSYNESLKDYLKSKSDDDILRDLINLKRSLKCLLSSLI